MEKLTEYDIMENERYQDLFAELSEYERRGIHMKMDGHPASPLQIVSACAVKEELSYMRDYITDDNGTVQEVCFVELNESV
nr:hypothetical protein [uncultured Sellimonas sp.]